MKAKILLISTRWINEHNPISIFSEANRCCNPNKALKAYFSKINNKELSELLAATKQNPQSQQKEAPVPNESEHVSLNKGQAKEIRSQLTAQLLQDTKLSRLYAAEKYFEFVQAVDDKIEGKLKDMRNENADQIEKYKEIKEKIRPYLSDRQSCVQKEKSPKFVYSDQKDDFNDCLDCNAINIDKEMSTKNGMSSGCTMEDRISLYKVAKEELYGDEENNEQISFMVYAVWPLGNSDKDNGTDGKQDSVRWIDQLTKAIEEECKNEKNVDDVELILLLHDNDMLSTKKTPLKTIKIDAVPSGAEKIVKKRTVAVYQHSNDKFIKLATPQNGKNAKAIYDSARNFIVDDFLLQELARLSGCLASYSDANAKNCKEEIKTKITDWREKKYIKDRDPRGYFNGLDGLFTLCNTNDSKLSSQCLIENNQTVNNLIKEIVFPEKYR